MSRPIQQVSMISLAAFFLASAPALTEAEALPENCCGGKDAWRWERWVGDEEREHGGWTIKPEGVVRHTHFQSVAGGFGHIIAVKFPRLESEKFPELGPDKHYFKGMNPGVGMLIAEQVEPGERWVFQIGDKVLFDDVGFQGGMQTVEITSLLEGHWKHTWSEIHSMNGFWLHLVCDDQLQFLYGSAGCQDSDIEELGFLRQKLLRLSIPDDIARCYVPAHAAGEVWTITIDGQRYETVASAEDVDPATKPLIDNWPKVAEGMPPPSPPQ